jgi:hypothetical protein
MQSRIGGDELFFDSAIVSHGYAPYSRDYDIVTDAIVAQPSGRYRYRFTHCPESHVVTGISDDTWRLSQDDLFVDHDAWLAAGSPRGFVWGVNRADAYPGLSYVANSSLAESWTARLGLDMHEVTVETNTFVLRLVCHDLRVELLSEVPANE